MLKSKAWLPTWLQPAAVLAVIGIAWVAHAGNYPAGESAEGGLIAAAVLLTVAGLVAALVDAARAHKEARPDERPGYQRMLDTAVPRGDTPTLPTSLVGDLVARLMLWGLVQAGLSLAVGAPLIGLAEEDGWGQIALFPMVIALVLVMLALMGVIGWLAVVVLRAGLRWADSRWRGALLEVPQAGEELNARPPWVFRAMLVALGVMLLGLATFWIPQTILTWDDAVALPRGMWGAFGVDDATVTGGFLVALWALRVTAGMVLGGTACLVVLSPIAARQMGVGRRRVRAEEGSAAPEDEARAGR